MITPLVGAVFGEHYLVVACEESVKAAYAVDLKSERGDPSE